MSIREWPATTQAGAQASADTNWMSISMTSEIQSAWFFPSKRVVGLDLWNHFSGFSELGETAEWRMKGRQPIAVIVRLKVSERGEGKPPTSYLIVSKIDYVDACVTDIIKPGKNQNASAHRLADTASTRPCKKTE
jgi:hypothetical protein